MSYIKFRNSMQHFNGEISPINNNTVIVSNCPKNTSGFGLYLDNDLMVGDYHDYVHNINDDSLPSYTYKYSNRKDF